MGVDTDILAIPAPTHATVCFGVLSPSDAKLAGPGVRYGAGSSDVLLTTISMVTISWSGTTEGAFSRSDPIC